MVTILGVILTLVVMHVREVQLHSLALDFTPGFPGERWTGGNGAKANFSKRKAPRGVPSRLRRANSCSKCRDGKPEARLMRSHAFSWLSVTPPCVRASKIWGEPVGFVRSSASCIAPGKCASSWSSLYRSEQRSDEANPLSRRSSPVMRFPIKWETPESPSVSAKSRGTGGILGNGDQPNISS